MKITAVAFIVHEQRGPFIETRVQLAQIRPDEVLVNLVATGICHTDIAVQHGKIPIRFPAVLGHEGAGIVREVGSAVEYCKPGDQVILSYASCASCRSCLAKRPYQCQTAREQQFGGNRPDGSSTISHVQRSDGSWLPAEDISTCFFGQSSFCNPAVVREVSCVKVPEDLPLKIACALGCGFQTGAGAVYNVVRPLDREIQHLAIFGMGGVGCGAVMAAKHILDTGKQLFDIIAIDINLDRLNTARELGATTVLNVSGDILLQEIEAATGGFGVDAVVDCTGSPRVFADMFAILAVGGVAIQVGGPPPGTMVSFDALEMLIQCKSYVGCHQGNAYSKEFIPKMAAIYADGAFAVEKLQKQYCVRDINKACEDMGRGDTIKPVLIW